MVLMIEDGRVHWAMSLPGSSLYMAGWQNGDRPSAEGAWHGYAWKERGMWKERRTTNNDRSKAKNKGGTAGQQRKSQVDNWSGLSQNLTSYNGQINYDNSLNNMTFKTNKVKAW